MPSLVRTSTVTGHSWKRPIDGKQQRAAYRVLSPLKGTEMSFGMTMDPTPCPADLIECDRCFARQSPKYFSRIDGENVCSDCRPVSDNHPPFLTGRTERRDDHTPFLTER